MESTANLSEPMETNEILEQLKAEAPARIDQAGTVDELEDVAADVTGRRSPIAAGRRSLGSAPHRWRSGFSA